MGLPGGKLTAGNVVVTRGYGLFAGHVIHCRPPVHADDPVAARKTLAACYVEALWVARARGFTSIAFPAIGTGIYRYPPQEAAEVAVRAVVNDLRAYPASPLVRLLFQDEELLRLYVGAAAGLVSEVSATDRAGPAFQLVSGLRNGAAGCAGGLRRSCAIGARPPLGVGRKSAGVTASASAVHAPRLEMNA